MKKEVQKRSTLTHPAAGRQVRVEYRFNCLTGEIDVCGKNHTENEAGAQDIFPIPALASLAFLLRSDVAVGETLNLSIIGLLSRIADTHHHED